MQYSLPYIILLLFFLGIAALQLGLHIDEKSRRHINFLVVIVYVLFFGFRGFIGWDWSNYYPFFKNIDARNLLNGFEIGFVYYTYLIKSLFQTYQSYILISTIINVIFLDIFLKRYLSEKYYTLGIVVFIGFSGFILEIDLMRNIKSILLFMLSLKYIENKSFLKFLALNIVGVLFHWSSLILLPLYFFLQKPISLKLYLTVFILGNIIFLLNITYIKPIILFVSNFLGENVQLKITTYFANELYSKSYALSIGYFFRQLITIFVLFYYDRILKHFKSGPIFINSFFILTVFFLYFAEVSIAVQRLSIIFSYSFFILIPVLLELIKPISTRYILILILTTYTLTKINVLSNNILYRYDNSLFGEVQSYKDRMSTFKSNNKYLEK